MAARGACLFLLVALFVGCCSATRELKALASTPTNGTNYLDLYKNPAFVQFLVQRDPYGLDQLSRQYVSSRYNPANPANPNPSNVVYSPYQTYQPVYNQGYNPGYNPGYTQGYNPSYYSNPRYSSYQNFYG